MTQSQVDSIADIPNLKVVKKVKYIMTDYNFDSFGKLISTKNTEITEDKAIEFANNLATKKTINSTRPIHHPGIKRLEIAITHVSGNLRLISLSLDWTTMPVVRSHDVMAIRPQKSVSININNVSAWTTHNGNTTYHTAANIRNINLQGVGTSFLLPTGGTTLSHGLTLLAAPTNIGDFHVFGSYQHATSSVTLAQSKVYNINSNGLGRVIDFTNQATRAKYDAMGGVDCIHVLGDLYCS